MNLNELLRRYLDPEQAAQALAKQEGILIEEARFVIALATGVIDGDVLRQTRDGSIVAAFPLNQE